jgi:hypothetical protein
MMPEEELPVTETPAQPADNDLTGGADNESVPPSSTSQDGSPDGNDSHFLRRANRVKRSLTRERGPTSAQDET